MNYDELIAKFGAKVIKKDSPIRTSIALQAKAAILAQPETSEQFIELLQLTHNLNPLILGGGANIVLTKSEYPYVIRPKNADIHIEGDLVHVGAGLPLLKLAKDTASAGLSGLEWCVAVPGRVGGSIFGNAGAFGGEIKDTLVSATIYDGVEVKTISNADLGFAYRTSKIKEDFLNGKSRVVIISATFKLVPGNPEELIAKMNEFDAQKKASQPMGEQSAGCTFKNIEVNLDGTLKNTELGIPNQDFITDAAEFISTGKVPVSWLLDKLMNFKGKTHKQFVISDKHANFIINTGGGTYVEWREFVDLIKDEVYKKYGIYLEEEVQLF